MAKNNTAFDVITVGSATIDVFAKTEAELIKIKTAKSEEDLIAYPVGSKILIKDIFFDVGGGGTNTAVSFSRLGFKTGYIGNVGNDENSHRILHLLEKEKVAFLGAKKGNAGYSVILDSIEEDRTILAFKGSNDFLLWKNLHSHSFSTKWFYCSSMMNASFKTLCTIAAYAKRHKIKLAFNPSSYQASLGIKALKPILSATTALILNKEEARSLLGMQNAAVPELVHGLHHLGIEYVSVTDGRNGAYVSDKSHILLGLPGKVKVVETTGAGDGFASAFVAGLILGKPLDICLQMGMVQAESVIAHMGAKNKLLTSKEMVSALKKDRRKIKHIR